MNIPSPLESVHYKELDFSVKRDDLIDPFVSGNKWRKLKYAFEEAADKSVLVTFGGAYSNHLLALAAAGAKFGKSTFAFVRGEKVSNEILFLCKQFGMEFQFVDRESYRDKKKLFKEAFGNNESAYFIGEGGSGIQGERGCVEIISELTEQYTDIFCAAGTGTTALGVFKGLQKHIPNAHLHIVPVVKNLNLEQKFTELYPTAGNYTIHEQYLFGGYAKVNSELLDFCSDFTKKTGILIDPVYTGKMFFALIKTMEQKTLSKSSKILGIHTGGTLGILGFRERFLF